MPSIRKEVEARLFSARLAVDLHAPEVGMVKIGERGAEQIVRGMAGGAQQCSGNKVQPQDEN
jgi:hypothetical protein